ncbi:MAG: prephenate dehydratase [Rhodothermales bacterium]|nr:prephenate dehydratase [Rhodothermales bacterium]
MNVCFQGEVGAYSEHAARSLFADSELVPLASFDDVFENVASSRCDIGVIPIENSLFGSVHTNYDLLLEHDLIIRSEISLRIRHNLMRLAGSDSGSLEKILSHPQALGQCKAFLRSTHPDAVLVPAYDTAGAAKLVAEQQLERTGAIASRQAAEEYGLEIVAADIETNHHNYTRFLALTRKDRDISLSAPTNGLYKTSVVYKLKDNVPGALFKSLAVFALRDIDLFKIESRPLVGSPGRYVFYFDIGGSTDDDHVVRALDHLTELADDLKILGSYPIGTVVE